MATALDQIKRALRMVGVLAEGETPSAEQSEAALITLNGMIGAWENEGVRLDLPTLSLAAAVPVPATHDDAVAYGLAARLADEYGRDAPPAVLARAESAFRALQATYAQAPELLLDPSLLWAGRRLGSYRW